MVKPFDCEKRQELIELLLTSDDDFHWEALIQVIEVESHVPYHGMAPYMTTTLDTRLIDLKYLIVRILSTSRILHPISISRKQDLSRTLLESQTHEDLMEVMLESMGDIDTIHEDTKQRIVTDFLDHAYHRLLLPDRFDCHDWSTMSSSSSSSSSSRLGRIQCTTNQHQSTTTIPAHAAERPPLHQESLDKNTTMNNMNECAVCLCCYPMEEQCKLRKCGHTFCLSCIRILSKHHNNQRYIPCPLCRTKSRSLRDLREKR
jgi:hypothetical protein